MALARDGLRSLEMWIPRDGSCGRKNVWFPGKTSAEVVSFMHSIVCVHGLAYSYSYAYLHVDFRSMCLGDTMI